MVVLLQVVLLFLAATVVFDGIHWLLHRFSASRFAVLRRVGALHETHHRFLDRDLKLHDEYLRANLKRHVVPEFLTQLAVSGAALLVLPPVVVLPVMGAQLVIFLLILRCRGKDVNHREIDVLQAYRPLYFCLPSYHALHHVHPDAYFSSWIKLFDHVMGSGLSLAGKRVAMTGAEGEFGSALKRLLERTDVARVTPFERGRDYAYGDYARLEAPLRDVDILILVHGADGEASMTASCSSFVEIIERFKRATAGRRLPVEVWALGSELECRPALRAARDRGYARAKRAFARHARRYYVDDRIIYRHIVPAPLRSPTRLALMSAPAAARIALFLIRRGFNYVPVTPSGLAVLNFLVFRWLVRPAPAGSAPLAAPGPA